MTNARFLLTGGVLRNNENNPICAITYWRGTYELHSGSLHVASFDSWEAIPTKLQSMLCSFDSDSPEYNALTELLARLQD